MVAWLVGCYFYLPSIPELVKEGETGTLFEPLPEDGHEPTNAEGLADALAAGLALARQPETRSNCRTHAEQFGWNALGPQFEQLYARLRSESR